MEYLIGGVIGFVGALFFSLITIAGLMKDYYEDKDL
jgi:hypothetical protein